LFQTYKDAFIFKRNSKECYEKYFYVRDAVLHEQIEYVDPQSHFKLRQRPGKKNASKAQRSLS